MVQAWQRILTSCHMTFWAQDQLAAHEAFAVGREEAAARIKASGDEAKDAAARDTAANKWMRSVVLPFAKYKRDEALRIKSDEVGFLANRHQRRLHTTASYFDASRLSTAKVLSSCLAIQPSKHCSWLGRSQLVA